MEMMLWILLCLFASVGIVQCGIWLFEAFKKPCRIRCGYHVIPLWDDPDGLEAQIRLNFSKIRQHGGEIILLADMGLGEECREICERLLWELDCVYICDINELPGVIKSLED